MAGPGGSPRGGGGELAMTPGVTLGVAIALAAMAPGVGLLAMALGVVTATAVAL